MNCVLCGRPLQPEAKFCENCGTQVASTAPAVPQTAPGWRPQPVGAGSDPAATEIPSGRWTAGDKEPHPVGWSGGIPNAEDPAPTPQPRPPAAEGEAPRLRPMGYGEILDETFDLVKKNALLFFGIAGVIYIPGGIAMSLLQAAQMSKYSDPTLMFGALSALIIVAIIYSTGASVARAAIILGVARRYLNHPATIASCYQAILPRVLPYFVLIFLETLAIFVGFMLCIIPGIFFSLWLAFCTEVYVIEGLGIFDSMKRSKDLVAGNMDRVFILNLVLVVLMMMLYAVPQTMVAAFGHSGTGAALSTLWQSISNTFVLPVYMIANVLLYYDIRVRKEGFDLQVLADHIGGSV